MSDTYVESPEWIVVLLTGGNPQTWTYALAADGTREFTAFDARALLKLPQYAGYVMLHARGHYAPDNDHIGNPDHYFWSRFRWSRRADTHVLERIPGMTHVMHHKHVPKPHPVTGKQLTREEAETLAAAQS